MVESKDLKLKQQLRKSQIVGISCCCNHRSDSISSKLKQVSLSWSVLVWFLLLNFLLTSRYRQVYLSMQHLKLDQ